MISRPANTVCTARSSFGFLVALALLFAVHPSARAISLQQIDDFQVGDAEGWQGAVGGVLTNVGPLGSGDHSLLVTTTGFPGGVNSRLLTYHGGSSTPVATHWTGDWSAAGVRQIAFDALNPNSFPLTIWLGIAGPAGPGGSGSNDAHVTRVSVTLPPDEAWHPVEFRVLADDFDTWGAAGSPAAALADVYQFRILHSPAQEWRGALGEASILLDNIRPIPEPGSAALLCALFVVPWRVRRMRRASRSFRLVGIHS